MSSTEWAERAREATRQQFGSALAEKATDRFCLSYAYAGAAPVAAAEAMGVGGFAPPVAAEAFAATPSERREAVIELRPVEREEDLGEAPAVDPDSAAAVVGAVESLGEAHLRLAERALATVARQNAVQAMRDRFYLEQGAIRDAVERSSAMLGAGAGLEARPRIGIAAAPVQACWLNGTIRADTHVAVLGDIAADAAVERIDVPRRIEPDALDVTIESAGRLRAQGGLSGEGVLVGVIDSEVQLDHPSLGRRVVHRRNYTREPFGNPDFHGTAVAGLIGAEGAGFTGMAPGVRIYNYKVLATASPLHGTDFEGALALQHALEDGVQVVNCSWGAGPAGDGSSREARACDTAWRLGMTIVKSAGNAGPGAGSLTTPADAEGVLVVGAASVDGKAVPDYSSRGPTADGRQRPHVLAPGGDFGAEIDGILLGGGVGTMPEVGTSFAAPHVTGLAALLVGREPKLTPDQIRDRIVATCASLPGLDANTQGAGLVMPDQL